MNKHSFIISYVDEHGQNKTVATCADNELEALANFEKGGWPHLLITSVSKTDQGLGAEMAASQYYAPVWVDPHGHRVAEMEHRFMEALHRRHQDDAREREQQGMDMMRRAQEQRRDVRTGFQTWDEFSNWIQGMI